MTRPSDKITGYLCCFCRESASKEEAVLINASWGEGMWQLWGAHRACLADRIVEDMRGGPLFGDDYDD